MSLVSKLHFFAVEVCGEPVAARIQHGKLKRFAHSISIQTLPVDPYMSMEIRFDILLI